MSCLSPKRHFRCVMNIDTTQLCAFLTWSLHLLDIQLVILTQRGTCSCWKGLVLSEGLSGFKLYLLVHENTSSLTANALIIILRLSSHHECCYHMPPPFAPVKKGEANYSLFQLFQEDICKKPYICIILWKGQIELILFHNEVLLLEIFQSSAEQLLFYILNGEVISSFITSKGADSNRIMEVRMWSFVSLRKRFIKLIWTISLLRLR